MKLPFSALLVIPFAVACSQTQNASTLNESIGAGIVGGTVINDKTDRIGTSVVKIIISHDGDPDRHLCTGAIIGEQVVLTAAHCVTNKKTHQTYKLTSGSIPRGSGLSKFVVSEDVHVSEIAIPESFQFGDSYSTQKSDIAVLKLEKKYPHLQSDSYLLKIDKKGIARSGAKVLTLGFGLTGDKANGFVMDLRLRSKIFVIDRQVGENMLLKSRPTDKPGVIGDGDSGCPSLMKLDDGNFGVVGVTSKSSDDYISHWTFTPVAKHAEWISSTVKNWGLSLF